MNPIYIIMDGTVLPCSQYISAWMVQYYHAANIYHHGWYSTTMQPIYIIMDGTVLPCNQKLELDHLNLSKAYNTVALGQRKQRTKHYNVLVGKTKNYEVSKISSNL